MKIGDLIMGNTRGHTGRYSTYIIVDDATNRDGMPCWRLIGTNKSGYEFNGLLSFEFVDRHFKVIS